VFAYLVFEKNYPSVGVSNSYKSNDCSMWQYLTYRHWPYTGLRSRR